MNSDPVDTLMRARDIILDPQDWTQGWIIAGTVDNYRVCSEGAFALGVGYRVEHYDGGPHIHMWTVARQSDAYTFLRQAATEIVTERGIGIEKGANSVSRVNDSCDHATVMDMFDRAIRLAKDAQE